MKAGPEFVVLFFLKTKPPSLIRDNAGPWPRFHLGRDLNLYTTGGRKLARCPAYQRPPLRTLLRGPQSFPRGDNKPQNFRLLVVPRHFRNYSETVRSLKRSAPGSPSRCATRDRTKKKRVWNLIGPGGRLTRTTVDRWRRLIQRRACNVDRNCVFFLFFLFIALSSREKRKKGKKKRK